jgi:hypothetical protein
MTSACPCSSGWEWLKGIFEHHQFLVPGPMILEKGLLWHGATATLGPSGCNGVLVARGWPYLLIVTDGWMVRDSPRE